MPRPGSREELGRQRRALPKAAPTRTRPVTSRTACSSPRRRRRSRRPATSLTSSPPTPPPATRTTTRVVGWRRSPSGSRMRRPRLPWRSPRRRHRGRTRPPEATAQRRRGSEAWTPPWRPARSSRGSRRPRAAALAPRRRRRSTWGSGPSQRAGHSPLPACGGGWLGAACPGGLVQSHSVKPGWEETPPSSPGRVSPPGAAPPPPLGHCPDDSLLASSLHPRTTFPFSLPLPPPPPLLMEGERTRGAVPHGRLACGPALRSAT